VHRAAGNGHGRDGLRAVALAQLEAGEPRHVLRGLLVPLGRQRRGDPRPRRRAHVVAVAPQRRDRLDRAAHHRLRLLVDAAAVDLRPARRREQLALAGQVRPHLLGHERHDRVHQRERALEHVEERGGDGLVRALVVEARLDQLEVPVADLAPEPGVQLERGAR
jgi:hypothetical protein